MAKITFIGAGSTVFAKNVLGDAMAMPGLHDAEIALYDINAERLEDSARLMQAINHATNEDRATITTYLGKENRRKALQGSDYIVNAIQVGGYEPCTVTDFDIPNKYGHGKPCRHLGDYGSSAICTPSHADIGRDIDVAPNAWLLNYTNLMCAITGAMLEHTKVQTVGLPLGTGLRQRPYGCPP